MIRRAQPEILQKALSKEEIEWGYLKGSKDEEAIKQLIIETQSLDEAKLGSIELKDICSGIVSSNIKENHQALILLHRKIKNEEVNIQDIVDSNILPYLLSHLSNPDYTHLNVQSSYH